MKTAKQNGKGMNMQKCHSVMKRFSGEAVLHEIAGVYGCTGIVVSTKANSVVRTKANSVVPTQTGTVVRSCSRMPMRACSGSGERRQTGKQVRKCICKSIFIHILKDSKQ
jgi:hypothetical protein